MYVNVVDIEKVTLFRPLSCTFPLETIWVHTYTSFCVHTFAQYHISWPYGLPCHSSTAYGPISRCMPSVPPCTTQLPIVSNLRLVA